MKFLVIGCGSIGQRHIKNLKKIGYSDILVFDSNNELMKETSNKLKINYTNSLNIENVDCTLICTPPNSHIKLAKKALKLNSHVFIEKPLSDSLNGIKQIEKLAKEKKLKVFVGYSFRFDKGLKIVKKLISANEIGQIFSFDAYEGWHLSNWRPWQNYEDSYTVKKNMGGGIILDGSHELNYLQWLGGKIELVYCMYSKIPNISKNVEGIAEILMKFNSKAIGRIHLDFLNPKYNRHCEILGDKGSIIWSFENKTIEIQKNLNKKIKKIKYGNDTNQMYIDEIKHVIKCIKGNKDEIISLKESINTLKTSLIIKKSGEKGKSIKI
jgi:predicted dehydrogenase